ncbi:DUF885 domain-containing protein [Sandarakinorhabdus sp.]|uniref:DUF885 domain-containing protein n=1 Tax=Sandarakinorhabdus sp. TaxID=1916663 RepID=UPI0038F7E004
MDRRQLLAGVAALAGPVAAQVASPGDRASSGDRASPGDRALLALFDAMFAEGVAEAPERATSLGLDTGALSGLKSRLSDYSNAGKARSLARAKDQLSRLRGIDRAALSPARQLDFDIVGFDLERGIESESRFAFGEARGNFQPYVITHSDGPYRGVPDFLDSQHKVAGADDSGAWLARLEAFAGALDQSTARLEEDAARGVLAPDFLLDLALPQMRALRGQAPEQTILVTSLVKKASAAGVAGDWSARASGVVAGKVFPALDRQIAAVARLRAGASPDAGVWKLPGGDEYYDAAVKSSTTTNMSAAQVHALGLAQVADISRQLDGLLKSQNLTQGSVGARLVALNERPDQTFPNDDPGRETLLTALRANVAAMYPRLPELFHTLPRAAVDVRRVPPLIQAGGAGAYYQSGTLDGARPGAFYINLTDTFDRPKFGLPTVTFHEAVPGHHMQVMIALESPDVPDIRRRIGYSAYSEGWALYAETLADEMGFYDGNPLGRIGYLQSLLFRATRLVVDTGIHFKRWSKDEAIAYMVETTGFARGRTTREIVRYCASPGQALSYKVGHTRWVQLRDAVKAKQGANFDIRAFHEILRAGPMPLVLLEREVMRRA